MSLKRKLCGKIHVIIMLRFRLRLKYGKYLREKNSSSKVVEDVRGRYVEKK